MEKHYPPDTTPFSSLEEYLEHRRRRDELEEQIKCLEKLNDLGVFHLSRHRLIAQR
jgi:uncharacterized protein YjiS (DUF1127 family)